MNNKQLIKIDINNGTNKGYCLMCNKYFKKNDFIIEFEKVKLYKVTKKKICASCYLKLLANKIGWKKLNALILKNHEDKI